MIFINEWLPNPTGSDAKGEFIELFNNGNAPVELGGWSLGTDNKKRFKLSGQIGANEYVVFPRSETKLSLKNIDGKLFLYDSAGRQTDQSAFDGSAPEGESFNRISYNIYGDSSVDNAIQRFVWGKPTPGTKNSAVTETGVSEIHYPAGTPLNIYRPSLLSLLGLTLLAGVIFAAISWYAIKRDENISQLFFG